MKSVEISKAHETDAAAINLLVVEVFNQCVASDYSQEGVDFFLSISSAENVITTISQETPIYIAKVEECIVGVLWMRDSAIDHISRYFVKKSYQRMGIGRKLFNYLLNEIKLTKALVTEISVNSSPGASSTYEKLGFVKTGEEAVGNGMRYIPMKYLYCD